jgi:hypothetical protein
LATGFSVRARGRRDQIRDHERDDGTAREVVRVAEREREGGGEERVPDEQARGAHLGRGFRSCERREDAHGGTRRRY